MIFRRLRTRMIAHIFWIVAVVILITFNIVYKLHQKSVREHLRSDAEMIADVVENILVTMMNHKTPKLLNEIFPELSRLHHIKLIRIISPDGHIKFSSVPEEKGQLLGGDRFPQFILTPIDSVAYHKPIGTNTAFFKWRKLNNKKLCQQCHGSVKKVNGVLYVETSDELSLHALQSDYLILLLIAIGVIAILSLVTYLLFIRSVDRPVQELRHAMEAVKQGNFSFRIKDPGKDELGQLASGMNSMVAKLQKAQSHLIEHHRQEMLQAEALAKMGELAASLAHEIKNPISGIVFAANSILRETDAGDKRREIFAEIAKQANRVEENLEALLTFARQSRLEKCRTNLNIIIERILLFIRQQPDMKLIEVKSELDSELPEVLVDPKQIEQVLLNLIINAVQAMPDGGQLMISTQYLKTQKRASISLQDTGKGIPENLYDKIFQPFFTTKLQGTGLGLTLCKEVILRHSGTISFTSEPGKGTTFILELPVGGFEAL